MLPIAVRSMGRLQLDLDPELILFGKNADPAHFTCSDTVASTVV
jgi:hypothetical protein